MRSAMKNDSTEANWLFCLQEANAESLKNYQNQSKIAGLDSMKKGINPFESGWGETGTTDTMVIESSHQV